MRKWEKVKSCVLRVTGYEFGRKTSQIDGQISLAFELKG